MNSNDDAMDLVSDLELTLGPSSRCIQGSLNDESGVGANAASRAEITFVANNPLSELVWSPHKGLSLRSSINSASERKSSISLGAGPSDMVHFPPHRIETETNKDDANDAPNLLNGSESYGGKTQTCKSDLGRDSGSSEKVVEMNTSSHINNAQGSMVGPNSLREEDMVCQGNTTGVIEATESNSPGIQDGRTANVLPISDELDLNTRPGELVPMKICGSLDLNDNSGQTHPLPLSKGGLLQEVHDLTKSKAPDSLMSNPPTQCKNDIQLETIAENKLQPLVKLVSDSAVGEKEQFQLEQFQLEQFQLELYEVSKASPIRCLASERKGKERVVSNGDMNEKASGEDRGSYGSAESCNSARLLGAEKRCVLDFEEKVTVGCKRVKLQIQETPGSTSFTGGDGSFMNWISTLIKGLSRPKEDGVPSLADASNGNEKKELIACSREQDNKCGNMGFQSLFQSLCRSNPKVQDQRFLSSDNPQTSESCKEVEVTEEALEQKMVSNESLDQLACKTGALHKTFSSWNSALEGRVGSEEFVVKRRKMDRCGNDGFSLPFEEKLTDDLVNERNQLGHLWMSHFCPKSSRPIAKRPEGRKVNPVVDSRGFKCSDAIASTFAKRLDAIKRILPVDSANKASSSATTCFFCGTIGHDLRDCPRVTESEVGELLKSITAFDEAEESPRLCIRCFQLNHWAIACPNAPSMEKREFERNLKLPDGQERQSRFPRVKAGCASSLDVNLEVNESSEWTRTISPSLEKVDASRGEQNASEAVGFSHPCSSLDRQMLDRPRGIFEAVKSLRLSRTHILKWMYSAVTISHLDGYYLRLRLGKLGKGLEGTGYYVACISGLPGEKSSENSKELISVIVGRIRCLVESQYISNQDFLEDELMAWWSTTIRGGGNIPSEDELWSKVEERRRLGL